MVTHGRGQTMVPSKGIRAPTALIPHTASNTSRTSRITSSSLSTTMPDHPTKRSTGTTGTPTPTLANPRPPTRSLRPSSTNGMKLSSVKGGMGCGRGLTMTQPTGRPRFLARRRREAPTNVPISCQNGSWPRSHPRRLVSLKRAMMAVGQSVWSFFLRRRVCSTGITSTRGGGRSRTKVSLSTLSFPSPPEILTDGGRGLFLPSLRPASFLFSFVFVSLVRCLGRYPAILASDGPLSSFCFSARRLCHAVLFSELVERV
jgi:hypothetical protein